MDAAEWRITKERLVAMAKESKYDTDLRMVQAALSKIETLEQQLYIRTQMFNDATETIEKLERQVDTASTSATYFKELAEMRVSQRDEALKVISEYRRTGYRRAAQAIEKVYHALMTNPEQS